jgi:hypothetical protein
MLVADVKFFLWLNFIDFELALELDSAEVRGVLVHDGKDWGGVVFEFLN